MRSPLFLLAAGLALFIAALSVWWYLQPQQTAAGRTVPGLPFQGPASSAATHTNSAIGPTPAGGAASSTTPGASVPTLAAPPAQEAEAAQQAASLFEPLPQNADEMDAWLQRQLGGPLANAEAVKLITQTNLIDRTVNVMVNLAKGQLARVHLPIALPQGKFSVVEQDPETFLIAEENQQRYAAYVEALEKFDPATLGAFYRVLSPALESAYRQLGEPGSFHNALKMAFDTIASTPDVSDAQLTLARPKVMYQFASPELEKLPPAQKLLLRIGQHNRERVKAVIQQWRTPLGL